MKRIYVLLTLLICICMISCDTSKIYVSDNNINVELNKELLLNKKYEGINVWYESSNQEALEINGYELKAKMPGKYVISVYSVDTNELVIQYLINVVDSKVSKIEITGLNEMFVNDYLDISIKDYNANYGNIIWVSLDEEVASVSKLNNSSSLVVGKKEGIVTIRAYLENDKSIYDELTILVKPVSNYTGTSEDITVSTEEININNMTGALKALIEKSKTSIIGVRSYYRYYNKEYVAYEASGIIYKRTYILNDGTEVSSLESVNEKFKEYKYYVVTNKHIVNNMSNVKIYDDEDEFSCNVIASDKKVNLSVLTFTSKKYFSEAKFGDSDECDNGEFILCVGNNKGLEYFHSTSFGVISYNNRYLSDDTDGDRVNDWDALYIQHDAATSDGSSGGALVNMKGEVIGINTLRISDDRIDNMGFAIPSNLALELIQMLEKGIVPERPLLNVSVYEVKDILASDTLMEECNVPEGLNYGIYVSVVDKGGVAYKAGIKAHDIILSFGGVKLNFSYELRAALNKCIIGSNEEVEIIILRNGEEITLKAVF